MRHCKLAINNMIRSARAPARGRGARRQPPAVTCDHSEREGPRSSRRGSRCSRHRCGACACVSAQPVGETKSRDCPERGFARRGGGGKRPTHPRVCSKITDAVPDAMAWKLKELGLDGGETEFSCTWDEWVMDRSSHYGGRRPGGETALHQLVDKRLRWWMEGAPLSHRHRTQQWYTAMNRPGILHIC